MKNDHYITKKSAVLELLNYKNLCLDQLKKTKKMLDSLPEINRENMYDFINHVQKVHTKYLCSLCDRGVIVEKDRNEYLVKLEEIYNYNDLEKFLEDAYDQMKVIEGYDLITLKEFFVILAFPWFLCLIYFLLTSQLLR